MSETQKLPEDLSPLNLQAYFFNAFGACGCSEIDEMHAALLRLMEWHDTRENPGHDREPYTAIYPEIGLFYLMAGMLRRLGLSEHGVAIRCPWLTQDGERLLDAMRRITPEAMDAASGEAYDGCHYGD